MIKKRLAPASRQPRRPDFLSGYRPPEAWLDSQASLKATAAGKEALSVALLRRLQEYL
jgi:hypothetical protein